MVNILAAILISAVVGFLAGHFSAKDNDPAPISPKEAVTGEIDAPPVQFNLPRPPPSNTAKPPPPSAPVLCEQGKTLQEQIANLKFVDMKTICREAETNWEKQNIEDYAPYGEGGSASTRSVQEYFDMVKESFGTASHWQGEVSITQGDRTIQLEVFTSFTDGSYVGGPPPKDGPVAVETPEKLCTNLSPFFVINGKGMPTGSTSSCGGTMRKRGDSFYFLWETHNDEMLAPVMSAVLLPIPGAPGALEYLNSQTGQWVTERGFHWKASTFQEFQEASQRHSKKVEEQGR